MNAHQHPSLRFEDTPDKHSLLITSQWLPAPLEEVFTFFSRPENLERLTPDQLRFQILTPAPILMREGLKIEYKLRVHHIPLHWTSLISKWDPPHLFTDEQIKGPYKTWVHTHRFEQEGNGTRVEDRIRFRVPGGRLMQKLIVQKDLSAIFRHRHRLLEDIFGSDQG